uniref:Basic tail secreted protein n=1 Tax=Rhipicephalus appendiculatus TaxID=34631 RepID=A0A131Z4D7_RHIAP
MTLVVSTRSAIFAAAILQAIFIGLSRPDSTSSAPTTAEPNITVEMCNQTCNSTHRCTENCFCAKKGNETIGECMTVLWDDMDYNETLPNITFATPIPKDCPE